MPRHERDWGSGVRDHPRFGYLERRRIPKLGEGVVFQPHESDIFHADEDCHHLDDAHRVMEKPASRCWDGLNWSNKPCSHCTISRKKFRELVERGLIPEVESNSMADPIETE